MPRLLDLFCGAGGCSMGYHRAGFEVIGVDLKPQPNYPFEFHQADAFEFLAEHGHRFDAIHASPPCQRFSTMTARWGRQDHHPDLIGKTRAMLLCYAVPWVIENVVGAPLEKPILLCGSMFGLGVRRHRLFECSDPLKQPRCRHRQQGPVVGVYGHSGGRSRRDKKVFATVSVWKQSMGIDWMAVAELSQAIPPAYTEYIGRQLLRILEGVEEEVPIGTQLTLF